ncbi:lipopolysaccharide biosynthesis protein [Brooklawnia cerclae]|uniref:PST family polysaccharide transporter n=1 Tax=Brooklawnia cerclae TaxID=349934 RepID=A0ABX0SG55_9ACTN|nr:lipopolysaccharide biosynthesis protein [Brooklawnia cerclae]NIH56894.1 PST family polysaccharide transporter [Brooklawnia cerclae]
MTSIADGARATLLGQWMKFATQAIGLVILARLLTPNEFGLYAMVVAITGMANVVGDFGFSSASIQAKEISNAQRSNLFWINIAIGAFVATILIIASPWIASFYGHPELRWIVITLALAALIQGATTQFLANFARSMRFRLLALLDVLPQISGLTVAIILASVFDVGEWALVAQQLTIPLVILVITLIASDWYPRLPSRVPMREFIIFGVNTFGVQLLTYLTGNLPAILLGRTGTAVETGLYNRADQLYKIPSQQIATPLTRVMLPTLSRRQNDTKAMQDILNTALRILSYSVGGTLAFFAANSSSVIEVVLGDTWANAVPLLSVLAVGGYFQVVGNVYYWAMLARAKTGMQLKFSIVTRILIAAFMFIGLPFGAFGIAVASATGLIINWLVMTLLAVPRAGLSATSFLRAMLLPFAVNLTLGIVTFGTGSLLSTENAWIRIAVGLAIWLVGIALGTFAFRSLRADVVRIFHSLKKSG